MKSLTLAHNIFITTAQRYALAAEETIIETSAVLVPVWKVGDLTTEPAGEIFASYTICSTVEKFEVIQRDDGFDLFIPMNMCNELLDVKDPGGKGQLMVTHHDEVEGFDAVHYISIQDQKVLDDSLSKSALHIFQGK